MPNKDVFTSLVRVKGNINYKVVSVKSNKSVEKHLWKEFSRFLVGFMLVLLQILAIIYVRIYLILA